VPFLFCILKFLQLDIADISDIIEGYHIYDIIEIMVVIPGYVLFSTVLPTEKYFKLRGFENSIVEFEYVKKILIVAVVVLLIWLVTLNAYRYTLEKRYGSPLPSAASMAPQYVPTIFYYLVVVTFATFLRITFQIARKEFRFYSAKAYFIIVSRQNDDYKKIRYFNYGLNSYNKYLRRRLKFEIGDIEKAYSRFIYADTTEKQEITKSVCESLEDSDRLKLARYLATLSKIPEAELFVSASLLQKLKTIGAFLATAITLIVSIIPLI
jgi:hypothetical protein